jgi:pyruvate formate-lyase/glycerol dehydratase family glycyl radical enzyme
MSTEQGITKYSPRVSLSPELEAIKTLPMSDRVRDMYDRTTNEQRFVSIEQAKIITKSYRETEGQPRILRRAQSLARALREISIRIDPEELVVGNRTAGIRAGVVFPEAGIEWINDEFDSFPTRPQDKFQVHPGDIRDFRETILPYWTGKGLRDEVEREIGDEVKSIERVVKINQKDHAQGHIAPNLEHWLRVGPAGIVANAKEKARSSTGAHRDFYEAVAIVNEAVMEFMLRYSALADTMAEDESDAARRSDLAEVSDVCRVLSESPASTFHEAFQSIWFLYIVLQMESNASSFSPGRLDQILYPYYQADMESGRLNQEHALELVECFWLKCNQVVYLRNSTSARYFAGFPVGINIAVGGQTAPGVDGTNALSYLMLKAQEHIELSQPNFSARLWSGSPAEFLDYCSEVIGHGSGMPQIFNDESIIPALVNQGIPLEEAVNYAVVGCVELTTPGNNLGWSDAAMFNMVKALELTINDGVCLLSGERIGLETGTLADYRSFSELEAAFVSQIDFFIEKMIKATKVVDRLHALVLPSPMLSSVIDDCVETGVDVTAGGARYNYSGIQAIQVANIADSLAVLKKYVFEDRKIDGQALLDAVRSDFANDEVLRQRLLNKVPKYGNDVDWVDELGLKWVRHFANRMTEFKNVRGGPYHTGLYTVSAHVPMGQNVGATPDGRHARTPLADGGLSAVYGRDRKGPTALINSVSKIDSMYGSNGTLLNMKFLPDAFRTQEDIEKFSAFLRAIVRKRIHHVQFNVLRTEDLQKAKDDPEAFKNLTVRVAGYTAYFVELAGDLQDEIIARTVYEGVS